MSLLIIFVRAGDHAHAPNIIDRCHALGIGSAARGKGATCPPSARRPEEFGFFSIEASALYKVSMIPDPRYEDDMARPKDNYSKTRRTMKKGKNSTAIN